MENSRLDQIKADLKQSYESFFHFSLGLIKEMDGKNDKLKFAVVNMQIALELFLKYYFIETNKSFWVFKNSNNYDFKPFSEILDKVFANRDITITKKKILKNVLESRNDIVHKGTHNIDPDILTLNLINTTLFIQGLLNREFSTSLIPMSYSDSEFSTNEVWRNGAIDFAHNLCELHNREPYECIFCYARALVDKKLFTYDEHGDEGFQCVSCLRDLEIENQIMLAQCKECNHNSFIVDHLNQQKDLSYCGCCVNCGMKYFAFNCNHCDKYFIDFDDMRIIVSGKIFCNEHCEGEYSKSDKSLLLD